MTIGKAGKALAHLGTASETVVGRAFYQRGETHRLRGAFEPASEMYREADWTCPEKVESTN